MRTLWAGLLLLLASSLGPGRGLDVYLRQGAACGIHTLRADPQALAQVQQTGCRWVAQTFSWREIAPWRGRYNWEHPDAVVRGAEYYSLHLVARLDQTPAWATASGDGNGPPDNLKDYGDFAEAVARRYRGRVAGYVIWNEPNLAREWGGREPNPAAYAAMLCEAYTRIRAADPLAAVVSAGLASTNDRSQIAVDDRAFLEAMYAAGAGACFDVLGVHPYGFAYAPDDPHGAHEGLNFARILDLRRIMEAHGDGLKPVWATETGWTTDAQGDQAWHKVTPEAQAAYLSQAFAKARREWPWLTVMAVWNLGDGLESEERDGHEKWGYRLLEPDGTPRPAVQALAAMPKTWAYPSPFHLVESPDHEEQVVALADDVVIHLGDNNFAWPWVPLYRGLHQEVVWPEHLYPDEANRDTWAEVATPSIVWKGHFYLREAGEEGWVLHMQVMQCNERANHVTVNGHPVEPRYLPVEDLGRAWVSVTFKVPGGVLRPGPNEVAVYLSKQIPDYRQIGGWDDFQFRGIWLEPAGGNGAGR
ncbi:MAG: hypothetical protein ACUVXG_07395 [Anaerolineae bacterium]